YRHVRVQPRLGDLAAGYLEVDELRRGHRDVVSLALDLVRPVPQHRVEHLGRDGDEIRVSDPRAVEAVGRLAHLVLAHPGERGRAARTGSPPSRTPRGSSRSGRCTGWSRPVRRAPAPRARTPAPTAAPRGATRASAGRSTAPSLGRAARARCGRTRARSRTGS